MNIAFTVTKILVALALLAVIIYFVGKTPDHLK